MPDYFLVRLVNGPAFDPSRARREQELWDEHGILQIDSVRPWTVWLRRVPEPR